MRHYRRVPYSSRFSGLRPAMAVLGGAEAQHGVLFDHSCAGDRTLRCTGGRQCSQQPAGEVQSSDQDGSVSRAQRARRPWCARALLTARSPAPARAASAPATSCQPRHPRRSARAGGVRTGAGGRPNVAQAAKSAPSADFFGRSSGPHALPGLAAGGRGSVARASDGDVPRSARRGPRGLGMLRRQRIVRRARRRGRRRSRSRPTRQRRARCPYSVVFSPRPRPRACAARAARAVCAASVSGGAAARREPRVADERSGWRRTAHQPHVPPPPRPHPTPRPTGRSRRATAGARAQAAGGSRLHGWRW